MSKRPDHPVSVDRRSFFRQLLASALDTVEKTGRELAQRAQIPLSHLAADPHPQTTYPTHDPHHAPYSWQVYGPPWPPPLGPPVPLTLQLQFRRDRRLGSTESVSRAANPEAAEAARAAECNTPQRLEP